MGGTETLVHTFQQIYAFLHKINRLFLLQIFIHSFPLTLIFRYVCERRRDGISKIGPFGDEEGSDEPEVSYDCDGEGNYTFERENITNEIILPKCLERRKPCI